MNFGYMNAHSSHLSRLNYGCKIKCLQVWMQLFSYNPHSFLFIALPNFALLNKMLLFLFQACLYSFYIMFPCLYHDLSFDVVGLAILGQDMSKFHVCAQIHMFLGFLPCLCLDLHAYVLFAMFMLRSTCLLVYCMFLLRSTC